MFDPGSFRARLVSVDGSRVAQGRDFGPDGKPTTDAVQLDEAAARGLLERLEGAAFAVRSKEEKPYTRKPTAPFRTATLQQEASRKLRYSSQTTMRVAQRLYENGYITYMRTDSTSLSEAAVAAARAQVRELYGPDYVPPAPRRYERKVKNAQEAHEAIRPAGDRFRTPNEVRGELKRDELGLYELIWKRTIASQMPDARGQTVSLRLGATSTSGEDVVFGASGTVITFPGFLAAYEVGRDDETVAEDERPLPDLAEGDEVRASELTAEGHSTSAPARYTEATLVRALEERGIGRPSTYAAIMGTILDRGYVFKRGTALVPSFLAFSVVELLEQHFGRLVDYDFTARLEDDLDRIAAGEQGRVDWLRRFYFGDGDPGLKDLVTHQLGEIDARAVNTFPLGEDIALRVGRYGPYVERGEERASVPPDLAPDELTIEKAKELLAQPSGERELGVHPETGRTIVAKSGRYGPYVTEVLPEDEKGKPRTALAVQVDVTRDDHARRRGQAAVASEDARGRSGRRRRGRRAQRPLRAVREEGRRDALPRVRGAAVHGHARAGARAARQAAGAPPARRGRGSAPRARRRPGDREADRRQGRPLRSVRDRRRDEREPARRRRGRVAVRPLSSAPAARACCGRRAARGAAAARATRRVLHRSPSAPRRRAIERAKLSPAVRRLISERSFAGPGMNRSRSSFSALRKALLEFGCDSAHTTSTARRILLECEGGAGDRACTGARGKGRNS